MRERGAVGSAKRGSDVDIALFGEVKIQEVSSIRDKLNEETEIPYFFDVIAYEGINNEKLREHVDEYGVKVYGADAE